MSSRLEARRASGCRVLCCALLALAGIGVLVVTCTASYPTPFAQNAATAPAVPRESHSVQATRELAGCSAGQIALAAADVGAGDAVRCLPVGGDEVEGSRVDPLYGRVADELMGRIYGRSLAGAAGDVKVVCWSYEDWKQILAAFREAGMIERGQYWLGWAPRRRGVVNLSYPACQLLDAIAYRAGRSALPDVAAAVGTLAHETMHVAGIDDEGTAECYTLQLTAETARRLGAEPEQARLLQARNVEYSEKFRAGTEYDSPDCYDGGPLDLTPDSSRRL